MTVGLSFVAAPWWALAVAGSSYGVIVDLIRNSGEARDASAVGLIDQSDINRGQIVLQNTAINLVQHEVTEYMAAGAKEVARQAGEHYLQMINNFAAQGGKGASQRYLAGCTERVSLTQRQFRLVQGAGKNAAEANAKAAATRSAASFKAGSVAAVIGLVFMREKLARAFHNLASELE